MSDPTLLTRRQALKNAACGFGALALNGLLAEQSGAAQANPLAVRRPHFKAKAKRVIFLFMQGGVSHVDSYDYKPRLDQRRRQDDELRGCPRQGQHGPTRGLSPGDEAVVEVQQARQERSLGVRPVPGDQPACGRPVLPPLDAHRGGGARPGHSLSALRQHQFPAAVDGLVGPLRPGDGEREPARVRVHCPLVGQRRAEKLWQRLPSRHLPGNGPGQGRRPDQRGRLPQPEQPPTLPRRSAAAARPLAGDQRRAVEAHARRLRTGSDHRLVRAGLEDAVQRPGHPRSVARDDGDAEALRHRREGDRHLRQTVPDGPAAVRVRRAVRAGDLRRQQRQPGLGPALQPAQARRPRPRGRSTHRRPAGGPEAARSAGGHDRLVGRGVWPDAVCREERHRPRPQPGRLYRVAGGRRRSRPASLTAEPTSSASSPWKTRSTCTTCTRPFCTSSASTTRS